MGKKSSTRRETMKGNTNGTKLKDADIRQQAFRQYCEHLAQGYPQQAWCFEHPQFTCTYKTMNKYIAENPSEFPSLHREVAKCKSYKTWFDKGLNMVDGKVDKCQPAIYQIIMRNIFDWDKENSGHKETSEPLVKKLANKWRGKNDTD